MTSFSKRVYAIVSTIPFGKVATYGQIARLAGSLRAGRAVGQLMAKNKDTRGVPCHRVVGSRGALTGYAFHGVSEKRKKLIDEGVSFSGMSINLDVSGWNK